MTSVTKEDIASALRSVDLGRGDTVLVHSSLSAFGHVEGGADAVVDALLETLGAAGTLVMPTFTWTAFHDKEKVVFDVLHTLGETGRIPEVFRRRPGALRSVHVCHSVAAVGLHARETLGEGVSPFGQGSTFDALYRLNAWNLLMGVGFSVCTALHSAEELAQVPYRAYRDFEGSVVRLADGTEAPSCSVEYLRHDGSSNDFEKMETIFAARGMLKTAKAGECRLMNIRIRDVVDTARKALEKDIRSLPKQEEPCQKHD